MPHHEGDGTDDVAMGDEGVDNFYLGFLTAIAKEQASGSFLPPNQLIHAAIGVMQHRISAKYDSLRSVYNEKTKEVSNLKVSCIVVVLCTWFHRN